MKEIKVITLKNGLKLVLLRNTTMRFYYFDKSTLCKWYFVKLRNLYFKYINL